MADRIAANILIGGPITAEIIESLITTAENDGAGTEWGGGTGRAVLREHINAAIAGNESVEFYDAEARWGEFEELEEFCRENGLSYRRDSAAAYEYDAEIVWWVPGMEDSARSQSDSAGEPVIPADQVSDILDGDKLNDAGKIMLLKKTVAGLLPPAIPPLKLVKKDESCKSK